MSGIKPSLQTIPNQIQTDEGDRNECAGPRQEPPAASDRVQLAQALAREVAPAGQWLLNTDSEKAEKTLRKDRGGNGKRPVDDDRAHQIRKKVMHKLSAGAHPLCSTGFHEWL